MPEACSVCASGPAISMSIVTSAVSLEPVRVGLIVKRSVEPSADRASWVRISPPLAPLEAPWSIPGAIIVISKAPNRESPPTAAPGAVVPGGRGVTTYARRAGMAGPGGHATSMTGAPVADAGAPARILATTAAISSRSVVSIPARMPSPFGPRSPATPAAWRM